jgi:hypothetical protein
MVDLKKYVQSGGTKKMKKSLLILGALAAMSMVFMGCPNSSTSDPTEAKTTATVTSTADISIAKNYTWTAEGTQDATTFSNWQTAIDAISDWTPAVGDVIRITFSGTASSAIKCIQANIVDNTQAAGWWTELNKPKDRVFAGSTADDATAVTELTETVSEYTITTAATAKGAAKIVIYVSLESAGYDDAATGYANGPDTIDLSDVSMTVELNPAN